MPSSDARMDFLLAIDTGHPRRDGIEVGSDQASRDGRRSIGRRDPGYDGDKRCLITARSRT